jgi:hypothetical protein
MRDKRTINVTARITQDEYALLNEVAKQKHMPTATFIRMVILDYCEKNINTNHSKITTL